MRKLKKQTLSLNKFRIASIDNSIKSKIYGGTGGVDDETDTRTEGSTNCKSKQLDQNTKCKKIKGIGRP